MGVQGQKSGETLYAVQYLRAFAALAVFYYHISATVHSTWSQAVVKVDAVGAAGVDLFFVISGFIMAHIVARAPAFDMRDFALRRIVRVAPIYWLVTLFVFALALASPSLFGSTRADPLQLLHSLLFVPYGVGDHTTGPVLLVGWTLNYEMFFYAVVAITAGLFGDRSLLIASYVLMALAAIGLNFDPQNGYLAFYTDPILLEFVLGIACHHIWQRTRNNAGSIVFPVLLVAGVALLFLQFERAAGEGRVIYWGVPAAMILLGALHAVRIENEWLRRFGDWSYALYLTHLFVVMAFIKLVVPRVGFLDLDWKLWYAIMTVVALAGAGLTYTLIERPMTRWLNRKLVAPVPPVDEPKAISNASPF